MTEKYEIHRGEAGWAIEELKRGKKVRREAWLPGHHLALYEEGVYSVIIIRPDDPDHTVLGYQMTSVSMMANDWELYKETEE